MVDDIDPDLFISWIEARPVLWDKTCDDYKDKNKKTIAWKEVCQLILPTFDELTCKEKTKLGNDVVKKWKNLKDNFYKFLKKLESLNKSGAGAKKIKEYHFYNQLRFLKKNAANLTESSIIEDQDSDVENQRNETSRSRYQQIPQKRKLNDEFESEILHALKENENRHQSFFKAILPSLNKLDDHQTLIFQSRVLQILTDFHQPPYQYHQTSQPGFHRTYQSNNQRQQPPYCNNYQSGHSFSQSQFNQLQCSGSSTDVSKTPEVSFTDTSDTTNDKDIADLTPEFDFSS